MRRNNGRQKESICTYLLARIASVEIRSATAIIARHVGLLGVPQRRVGRTDWIGVVWYVALWEQRTVLEWKTARCFVS